MSPFQIAAAASFAALALLFGLVFTGRAKRGTARGIERRLRLYSIGASGKKQRSKGVLAESPVARRAVGLLERLPRDKRRDDELGRQLERAGWPLRPAELTGIRILAAAGGAIFGAVVMGKLWLAGFLGVVGFLIPKALLSRTIAKRTNQFLMQLPDTLQLLAGSLQAGYGLVQAVDTLVKESPPPTSTEFSRVLAETRLGMTLEESLHAMAERVDSDDFRWVVMAIAIQRQVGGNLAALLTTVATTLRDREAVRRQIKTLSAEGRLSAYILTFLPFGIAGYVAMVNPEFLGTLTGAPMGRVMIGVALGLMGIGIVWMRKIIRIEV